MCEPENKANLETWRQRADDPRFGHGYVRFAELLLVAGQGDEAITALEKGLAKGAVCHGAWLQLGRALFIKGRDIEARSHLLRLLAQDPENICALGILADHARDAGRWQEAGRFYLRLTEVDPQNQEWPVSLQMVRQQAISGSQPETEINSEAGKRPMSTMTLVDIYLAQGYRDQALAVLREMAAADPVRADIPARITEIEQGLNLGVNKLVENQGTGVAGTDAVGRPGLDPARLAQVRRQAAERRAAEKQQFKAWVDNLRGGPGQ